MYLVFVRTQSQRPEHMTGRFVDEAEPDLSRGEPPVLLGARLIAIDYLAIKRVQSKTQSTKSPKWSLTMHHLLTPLWILFLRR